MTERRPSDLDIVDASRGPTASQAIGLTLATARRAIAAAQAVARDQGIAMSVAVVDAGDHLVAFERMDGADLVTVVLARDKAYSALLNRMPTRDLAPVVQPGQEFYGYDALAGGRMVVFAGGIPIEIDGVLAGAVGVSGGDTMQDQLAAEAAAEAVRT